MSADHDRAVELYAKGVKQVDIARELGVSKQRVWQILKAARGMCGTCGLREVDCKCIGAGRRWVPGGRGRMPDDVRGPTTFSGCFR